MHISTFASCINPCTLFNRFVRYMLLSVFKLDHHFSLLQAGDMQRMSQRSSVNNLLKSDFIFVYQSLMNRKLLNENVLKLNILSLCNWVLLTYSQMLINPLNYFEQTIKYLIKKKIFSILIFMKTVFLLHQYWTVQILTSVYCEEIKKAL